MLSIDTGRLQLLLTSLSRLSTNALRNDLQCQLLYIDSFSHRQKIQQLFRYEHDLSNQLYHVKQYISKTLQEYECLEIKLQRQISILPTSHTLWKAQVPKGTILNHVTMDSLGMNVDVSHNISLTKDPKSYLTEGIIANIKADFYGLRIVTVKVRNSYDKKTQQGCRGVFLRQPSCPVREMVATVQQD